MFEINLMKDRTVSAPVRKALFWSMSLYLALCIGALAWLANWGTQRLIGARRLSENLREQEREFQRSHHQMQDVLEFARHAKTRLELDAQSLEAVDALIRDRVSLVNIVSALTAPLPAGVDLLRLDLDGKEQEITFSVMVPEGRAEQQIAGGYLTSIWNADESLQYRLDRIRIIATKRDRVQGEAVVVMQFAAGIK